MLAPLPRLAKAKRRQTDCFTIKLELKITFKMFDERNSEVKRFKAAVRPTIMSFESSLKAR